jgi:hypothetical protein
MEIAAALADDCTQTELQSVQADPEWDWDLHEATESKVDEGDEAEDSGTGTKASSIRFSRNNFESMYSKIGIHASFVPVALEVEKTWFEEPQPLPFLHVQQASN